MSLAVFNREIKRLITNKKHPVLEYVNEKFKHSRKYDGYHDFFDNFLYEYGVLTVGHVPIYHKNKYMPYVNCSQNNIFGEETGVTDLSNKPVSPTESRKIMAQYIIDRLICLEGSSFKGVEL